MEDRPEVGQLSRPFLLFKIALLDRSKRRHVIRKKMSAVKLKVSNLARQYSLLNGVDLSMDECLNGLFPWTDIPSCSTPNISGEYFLKDVLLFVRNSIYLIREI